MTPDSTAISQSPASPNIFPMLHLKLQIVWKLSIMKTTLSHMCGSFQAICVAFANNAWSSTTAMFSSRSKDMIFKAVRRISCTLYAYLWQEH